MSHFGKKSEIMQLLYNAIMVSGTAAGLPVLMASLLRPKRRATMLYRLGWKCDRIKSDLAAETKKPIWIHALSVGEVISAEPLVERLHQKLPEHPLVFSTSTQTGMATAQRLYGGMVQSIFYYPYDYLFAVHRITRMVDPRLVVIVETDLWPNFLFHLKKKGVPAVWVNARISANTYKGYRLLGDFARSVIDTFAQIGAQSNMDADRLAFLELPADKVELTGNVKFDQTGCGDPVVFGRQLRKDLGIEPAQPVLVFGSTHPGEEEAALGLFLQLKQQHTDLVLILAPRDPGRADSVAKLFREKKVSVKFLSSLKVEAGSVFCDVRIVNTIGLLRDLYAVADIAFVGGSLVSQGGHNPLEPAAFGKPVLFGSDMSDFSSVARLLLRNYAAVQTDADGLYTVVAGLLKDAPLREQMGRQALKVFNVNKGAVDKTMAAIENALSLYGNK